MRGYGSRFTQWIAHPEFQNDSWGNGALMRVSPLGLIANDLEQLLEMGREATYVSHAHPDAMRSVSVYLTLLDAAITGARPGELLGIARIAGVSCVPYQTLWIEGGFHVDAKGTLVRALACIEDTTSFADVMHKVIKLGGDVDTNGAIAGALAEALFGIPIELVGELRDVFWHGLHTKRDVELLKAIVRPYQLSTERVTRYLEDPRRTGFAEFANHVTDTGPRDLFRPVKKEAVQWSYPTSGSPNMGWLSRILRFFRKDL